MALHGRAAANHIHILIGLVIVTACTLEAIIAREPLLADPDIWWHIKTGAWIWQHGAVPTTDPFSFTYAGHPWIAKEWLSQLIFYGTFAAGGWALVAALGAALIALSAALLYWCASNWIKPSIAASIALVCILLTSSTFTVRPHLLTLPIVIVWTYQVFDSSLKGRAPNFLLLALLVVWANLHAAFTMGFVIAFFAFLDFVETTRLTNRKELWKWLLFLALCPLVTLLHPYSYKAMMATLLIVELSDVGRKIAEWQPFIAPDNIIYSVALLGMVFAALTSGFRLGMARALLIVCLTYLFMAHIRYAFFLFPVITLLVVAPLAITYPAISASRWRMEPLPPLELRMSAAFRPAAAIVSAILVGVFGLLLLTLPTAPPDRVAVAGAIDFLKAHRGNGNVMNYYDYGGPLIFNDIPTFVDGRAEQLFLGDFAKDAAAEPATPEEMAKILDKYKIDWTMLPPGDPRTKLLDKLPGWGRAFSDKFSVIHQRTPASSS